MGKSIVDFINKILDTKKLIFRLWIVLWLCLLILLILKFCFGIWYPIVVENENFIKVCDFADNNLIFNISIRIFFFILSSNILLLTIIGKRKYDKWYLAILSNAVFIGIFLLKDNFEFIGLIFEVGIIVFAIIFNLKTRNFRRKLFDVLIPIIVYIVVNAWQFSIYFVRDLDIKRIENYGTLIGLILMLDYYVFLIITFMEVCYMGTWSWGWLFGKSTTELRALKEAELKKENPDKDFLEVIDKAIAKNESK